MEVGDEQKSEEMAEKYPSGGRLVNMGFATFSLLLHGGGRQAEK